MTFTWHRLHVAFTFSENTQYSMHLKRSRRMMGAHSWILGFQRVVQPHYYGLGEYQVRERRQPPAEL